MLQMVFKIRSERDPIKKKLKHSTVDAIQVHDRATNKKHVQITQGIARES